MLTPAPATRPIQTIGPGLPGRLTGLVKIIELDFCEFKEVGFSGLNKGGGEGEEGGEERESNSSVGMGRGVNRLGEDDFSFKRWFFIRFKEHPVTLGVAIKDVAFFVPNSLCPVRR